VPKVVPLSMMQKGCSFFKFATDTLVSCIAAISFFRSPSPRALHSIDTPSVRARKCSYLQPLACCAVSDVGKIHIVEVKTPQFLRWRRYLRINERNWIDIVESTHPQRPNASLARRHSLSTSFELEAFRYEAEVAAPNPDQSAGKVRPERYQVPGGPFSSFEHGRIPRPGPD
jgi:hypothetical protein